MLKKKNTYYTDWYINNTKQGFVKGHPSISVQRKTKSTYSIQRETFTNIK